MIPTRRTFVLGVIPLVVILAGRGSPTSVELAWGLFCAVLLACVADAGIAAARRRALSFSRTAPPQLYVDQPQNVSWLLENRGLASVSLRLRDGIPESGSAEPASLETELPRRSRLTLTYRLRVSQRGPTGFGDAVCRIRGPLGLAWHQFRVPAALELRALPHLANWKAAQLAARKAMIRQAGSHRFRWKGSGTTFESLREYTPEDDIRWLDWKATSRQQQPISRNYEVERHQHVMLLVDASRMMTTYCGSRTKFDTVLEAALLVTRASLDQGDSLGLVLFSDRIEAYVPPRRDQKQNTIVMETLYARYPRLVEPDFETALTLTTRRVRRRSLLVLFTDLTVTEAAQRMLRYVQMIGRRHLCLVVTIADDSLQRQELIEPQNADELYRVGVASQMMLERAEILERIRRSGADVLDSPADQVAARTIERYLELKRRLRL